jgi:hypothetical protein
MLIADATKYEHLLLGQVLPAINYQKTHLPCGLQVPSGLESSLVAAQHMQHLGVWKPTCAAHCVCMPIDRNT